MVTTFSSPRTTPLSGPCERAADDNNEAAETTEHNDKYDYLK